MSSEPTPTRNPEPQDPNNGFWKGKTEARVDGLEADMREVKGDVKDVQTDVKRVLAKLDALTDQWSHLPCHDPGFLPQRAAGCPPGRVEIGANSPPTAGDRLNAMFEGWKGRAMFLISSGVISVTVFASFWVFVMSSSKVQAILKLAETLAKK